ncbi:hypothetical protein F5Y08DRAFT_332958 [Xylaria arbuscula]|nr:hypothetical protein F5Y08DRAFT_332958 [Xylaria arbuscula]
MAAAILRQLVETKVDMLAEVRDLYGALGNGRSKLRLDDITTLVQRITQSDPAVFIVVDAVDECGSYRTTVLRLLRKISNNSSHLLISGRSHVTEIDRIFDSYSQLEIKARTSDIMSFAEGIISSSELSELIPCSSKQNIVRQIAEQASGIFLIAILKCMHFTHLSRFSEIRKAVQARSRGLHDLYQESMERIRLQPGEKRRTAMKIMSWIYHSRRQLSVEELVHALAIDVHETIPEYEDVISEKTVLDVQFVHHTLQEYLEASYQTWFHDEPRYITKVCLTYLRLMSPYRGLADSLTSYPFLRYAASYWGTHAREEYCEELDDPHGQW